GPEEYSPDAIAAYIAPLLLAVLVPFVAVGAIVFAMSRRGAHWWPQFFFALLAAILAFTFLLPQVEGQETKFGVQGAEVPEIRRLELGRCFIYRHYVVRTVIGEDVGEEILVVRRAGEEETASCAVERDQAQYVFGGVGTERWFAGIYGDLLFVDIGTGPGIRGLVLRSLTSGAAVYEGTYADPIVLEQGAGGAQLSFYVEISPEAGEYECPMAERWAASGLGHAYEVRVILELATLELERTGEVRCSPRQ
ncbi:MAG: hypothetical protein PVG79_15010, partial [Gemmatimonadales bacterium]